ncbi:MAG TPA: YhjD/YihY/BrkB family envelope integrity protein [Anaeromyxobacteraceae bacterium]|nr:YhjD/YihY/BrkB family envelope integrity protein [Anaeromyxobacteraceae bacterium]
MAPGPRGAARLAAAGARSLLAPFRGASLRLRAMSLTYISLFAVVPALVVAFSVLEAFAGTATLSRVVHGYLLDNLAVGARASIEPQLERFIQNAHATSAGVVGGAFLVVSAVGLFASVEQALNEIWAVRRARPVGQRALIYWAGLTLAPVLLAGSLALGHWVGGFIEGGWGGQLLVRAAGVVLSCLLFTALYLFVPATRVRIGGAAAGGLAAGLAWELAKGLYTLAVARFFRYHAIYGSVAAVPIFLLWLYVSWTIVLWGARVSFVVQHARVLLRGHAARATPLGHELLAAQALLEVALAFRAGAPPPDMGEVAERLATFGEPVREVLGILRVGGLVHELSGGGLVPARPLAEITLADVRRAVSGAPPGREGDGAEALVSGLLAAAEGAAADALAASTYEDLCRRVASVAAVAPAAEQAG